MKVEYEGMRLQHWSLIYIIELLRDILIINRLSERLLNWWTDCFLLFWVYLFMTVDHYIHAAVNMALPKVLQTNGITQIAIESCAVIMVERLVAPSDRFSTGYHGPFY